MGWVVGRRTLVPSWQPPCLNPINVVSEHCAFALAIPLTGMSFPCFVGLETPPRPQVIEYVLWETIRNPEGRSCASLAAPHLCTHFLARICFCLFDCLFLFTLRKELSLTHLYIPCAWPSGWHFLDIWKTVAFSPPSLSSPSHVFQRVIRL